MRRRRIQELRNEGEEERRGLGIERLDQDAFAKRPLRSGRRSVCSAAASPRLAKGPDAEPDQIERAGELQRGEKLRAGKDDRRDAERRPRSTWTSPPSAVPNVDAMPARLPPDSVRAAT